MVRDLICRANLDDGKAEVSYNYSGLLIFSAGRHVEIDLLKPHCMG
jgi:hypothetical protein